METIADQSARHVHLAKLLERAVHDPGPWTVRWRDVEVPADRIIHDRGVTFSAWFPAHCVLGRADYPLVLTCRGVEVSGRSAEGVPREGDFNVTWDIAAPRATETAAA